MEPVLDGRCSLTDFDIIIIIIIIIIVFIILPVVLYGCETWSLTLTEERRLRVFENWVLRRIFWPKGDEVIGEWRKLHNDELTELHSSPNIIRMIKSKIIRWAGHITRMGDSRGVCRLLMGNPEFTWKTQT